MFWDECWDHPTFGDGYGHTCSMYIENGWCTGCSLNHDNFPLAEMMDNEDKEDVLKNCCYGCDCANREEDSK